MRPLAFPLYSGPYLVDIRAMASLARRAIVARLYHLESIFSNVALRIQIVIRAGLTLVSPSDNELLSTAIAIV